MARLREVGVAVPVVEAGADLIVGMTTGERRMAEGEGIVANSRHEPSYASDAMMAGINDNDHAEMAFADG